MTMTNKDLTWKLKAQPTAGEVADLVKHGVLTPDEARAIIFNKGKKIGLAVSQPLLYTIINMLSQLRP